jgi:flagellar protein FliS
MLYDGAIRFAAQAKDAIDAGNIEETYNLITRAQKIVLEMQNGLKPEVDPEITGKMSALYSFVYRKLVDANINRDSDCVEDALKILRYQRETWVMLMERVQSLNDDAPARQRPTAAPQAPPTLKPLEVNLTPVPGSLSVEG